jgi:hypothetical protein
MTMRMLYWSDWLKPLPIGCRVTVLADRGFCDTKLYRHLNEDLGFGYEA